MVWFIRYTVTNLTCDKSEQIVGYIINFFLNQFVKFGFYTDLLNYHILKNSLSYLFRVGLFEL